jgi:hypothetical protein
MNAKEQRVHEIGIDVNVKEVVFVFFFYFVFCNIFVTSPLVHFERNYKKVKLITFHAGGGK